jgi:WD40 repeat protein
MYKEIESGSFIIVNHYLSSVLVLIVFALLTSLANSQVLPVLVRPNGGNLLSTGATTMIEWSGVPADDTVGLDYSLDGGKSWIPIIEQATGLSYSWKLPDTVSTKCQVRVRHHLSPQITPYLLKSMAVKDSIIRNTFSLTDSALFMTSIKQWGLYYLKNSIVASPLSGAPTKDLRLHGAFHRDSLHVLMANSEGGVALYNIRNPLFPSLDDRWRRVVSYVEYSPSGNYLFGVTDTIIHRCNPISNFSFTGYVRAGVRFTIARFAPADTMYAVACSDTSIDLVDASRLQRIRNIPTRFVPDRLAFTRDGSKLVLSSHNSGTVEVIDIISGNVLRRFPVHNRICVDMALSGNDSLLATVDGDGVGKVWSMASGGILFTIPQISGNGLATGLAFSNDGRRLVDGERGHLAIWLLPDNDYYSSDVSDSTFSIQRFETPIITSVDMVDFQKVVVDRYADTVINAMVKNRSDHQVMVTAMKLQGADTAMFEIVEEELFYPLASGMTRTISLGYHPLRMGEARAQLLLEYGEPGSPAIVELRGEGVLPAGVIPGGTESSATVQLALRPNPANATVEIELGIRQRSDVQITVVDQRGREVATILGEVVDPGRRVFRYDVSGLAAGIYYCHVATSSGTISGAFRIVR